MSLKNVSTVLFLSLATLAPAHSQTPTPPPQIEERPLAWFVELHGKPTADGGSPAALAAEKEAFRGAATRAGARFRERLRFDKLFNGFSVDASALDVAKLSRLPEVKAVHPVHSVPAPEVQPLPEPDLATALAMTQADIAREELGLTGRGIRVAVIDSGIDYDHPDLGGCFGPGCRVAVGYDFVGDAYNSNPNQPSFNPVAVPDPLPDDCMGHGTHVAGILGANGQVRGVAPEITFGAYRIFGCQGSGSTDLIIAALERAVEDGADIINLSLGANFIWPDDPLPRA
ncbi:MAG TPA: S8 family serine peptidase, partial [Thermoanaerobaculia bacterium]|nr:S8 family serine peptidase [Thermoanaerobaculia bacterium]